MGVRWLKAIGGMMENLTPNEKVVLMVLAFHMNDYQDTCWPDYFTIGMWAGIEQHNVGRAVRGLEAKGMIKRIKSDHPSGGKTYRFPFSQLENLGQIDPNNGDAEGVNFVKNGVNLTQKRSQFDHLKEIKERTEEKEISSDKSSEFPSVEANKKSRKKENQMDAPSQETFVSFCEMNWSHLPQATRIDFVRAFKSFEAAEWRNNRGIPVINWKSQARYAIEREIKLRVELERKESFGQSKSGGARF